MRDWHLGQISDGRMKGSSTKRDKHSRELLEGFGVERGIEDGQRRGSEARRKSARRKACWPKKKVVQGPGLDGFVSFDRSEVQCAAKEVRTKNGESDPVGKDGRDGRRQAGT